MNGDEMLARELAAIFLQDLPGMLESIRDAVRERDGEALRMAAHAFKGAVANFGFEPAHAAAFKLERLGREQAFVEAESALAQLRQESEAVTATLRILAPPMPVATPRAAAAKARPAPRPRASRNSSRSKPARAKRPRASTNGSRAKPKQKKKAPVRAKRGSRR
jgi:HPt (histidine-containing phosphotransfer) domain-containing protein